MKKAWKSCGVLLMKYLFDGITKRMISLDKLPGNYAIKRNGECGKLFWYEIKGNDLPSELYSRYHVLYYLDCFILLLPSVVEEQQVFWQEFYRCFGNEYESLIDKKRNLMNINLMLKYIETTKKMGGFGNILDFGCGSGISMEAGYKGQILGYEPVKEMRVQAEKRGMKVFYEDNFDLIPNNYFDAVFASYVFHMCIMEKDILRIIPKVKADAVWLANYYKDMNKAYVNDIFKKNGFAIKEIYFKNGENECIYEYTRM